MYKLLSMSTEFCEKSYFVNNPSAIMDNNNLQIVLILTLLMLLKFL